MFLYAVCMRALSKSPHGQGYRVAYDANYGSRAKERSVSYSLSYFIQRGAFFSEIKISEFLLFVNVGEKKKDLQIGFLSDPLWELTAQHLIFQNNCKLYL